MKSPAKHHTLTLVFPEGVNVTSNQVIAALHPLNTAMQPEPSGKVFRVALDKPLTTAELSYLCPKLTEDDFPPHDRILQSLNPQGIRVAFFDMDSTVIENECINELADMCGVGKEVAEITHEAMVKEMPFEESLNKRIQIIIKSNKLTQEMLEKCYTERIKIKSGARELLQKLNDEGVHTVLVSGGFSFFTERVAKDLGFKEHYSNELIFKNEKLADAKGCPALDGRIVGAEAKLAVVDKVIGELNKKNRISSITRANAAATGDGGNDALMVGAIADAGGMGVAFCDGRKTKDISPKLLAAANVHIDHLESLIHAQCSSRFQRRASTFSLAK